jgi:hypothetical protein
MTKEEREKAKAAKIAKKKEPMKDIIVNTLSGKSSLYDNMIEKKAPKKIRTIQNPFVVVKDVFDKGFVFKDGFEIRHVDSKFWSLYNENIREVRERKPV